MVQLVFFIFQKRFSAFFAIPLLINRKSNDFIETTLSSTLNELFFFIIDIPVLGWGLIATWWIFLITTSCKHPIKKLNLVSHIGFSKSCLENGMIKKNYQFLETQKWSLLLLASINKETDIANSSVVEYIYFQNCKFLI